MAQHGVREDELCGKFAQHEKHTNVTNSWFNFVCIFLETVTS
jgi:hypothetical protein